MRDQVRLHYHIEDYMAVLPRVEADAVFRKLCALLNELGLPLNTSKLTAPTKKLAYLGIDIDVNHSTLSIPQEKLYEILDECIKVRTKNICPKGHINH